MDKPKSNLIVREPQRYYIGTDKPVVNYITEIIVWPSKFEDTDNMPDDPEQAGWDELISKEG